MLIHLFHIHAWLRMIEAARRDKNGMLQCAVVSQLGHSLGVVMSVWRESSNQPIGFLKLCRDIALRVAEVLCAMGGGGITWFAIWVPCILKGPIKQEFQPSRWPYHAPLQIVVKCMIWAVHKTEPPIIQQNLLANTGSVGDKNLSYVRLYKSDG